MSSFYDWSRTASSNATADSLVNWAEGQDPGSVNDSARAMMQRLAELRDDITGTITAGGTANALTVTAFSSFTTLANGRMVVFIAASDNTTAATLNVNGIGAKSIRKMDSTGDVALIGSEIQAGGVYLVAYNTALNGAAGGWLLINPSLSAGLSAYPASSNDNRLVRTDGTSFGLQQSGITVDDSNNVSGIGTIGSGAITSTGGIAGTTGTFSSTLSASGLSTGGNLAVTGSSVLNGVVTMGNQVLGALGGTGSPGYTFSGDSATGIYHPAVGQIGFTVNANVATISGTGLHLGAVDYSITDAAVGLSLYNNSDPIINVGRSGNAALQVKRRASDGAAVNFYRQETNVGTISVTAAATAYNTSSDGRKKENFRPFDSGAMLDQIEFGQFEWIATGETSYGVIAQQVQPVFPQAISEEDGWLFADYSKLVPLLGAEIKALRARVAQLEAHSSHSQA
jgi:hypothetical protein